MRTIADMLGGHGLDSSAGGAAIAIQPGPGLAQVGAHPLGARTGAPPWTSLRMYQVAPATLGQSTLVVEADKSSRSVVFTAPLANFYIYIGNAGVKVTDFWLPAGLPYEVVIPGNQPIYAVTDAPIYMPLRVQAGPLLIGDRER